MGDEGLIDGVAGGVDGDWGAVLERYLAVRGTFDDVGFKEDGACCPLSRRHLDSDFGHRIEV